ncbi:alpha-amylase family glycosyl hydrolase [Flammeovirga agarivorans]|uniref:T9SS type A sorting domain-containing protein n=1 Tax=Flammeovirga agarivorans TaxID=2726742 RepID=A0A7X8XYD1_9BACT|nr:alpha-amylase family glycosyl hydrolase [Flammeovirga agarivorans]NLR94111.1 T9SS type A sorting domain-containing protein [Flammeovirga agarivorans]
MKKLLLQTFGFVVSFLLICSSTFAQKVTLDPSTADVLTENVTVTFDVSGTDVAGISDLYLWGWSEDVGDFLTNGEWAASDESAKLTKQSDNIFTYSFPVTKGSSTYNNFAELLNSASAPTAIDAIGCLIKTKDGGSKTGDLVIPIKKLGVSVEITSPKASDVFLSGDKVIINISSPTSTALKIKVNGVEKISKTGTSLSYTISSAAAGELTIEASASSDGLVDTKELEFYVGSTPTVQDRPDYATNLGVNKSGSEVTLVLQDPAKLKKFVNVIGSFNNWGDKTAYPMKVEKGDENYWWYTFTDLDPDTEYIYQYFIDGTIIIADPYTEKVSDPDDKYIDDNRYPNLIDYPTGKTSFRASTFIINEEEYVWKTTNFTPVAIEDAVVYELLFRDFTTEATYESAIAELDYIKSLGANTIHLMPVNEFEGNSSWGYNPNFYFAPDKYYGPKNKLKEFIDEAHSRGISVIIDLVLNHSFHSSPMVRMYNKEGDYADPSAENPWFNEKSNFTNPGLQWGADFDHESDYTKALVDSVNAHWMQYYKVDGYRFDFTKGFGNNVKTGDDEWGSNYDQDRIDLLLRMNTEIKKRNPNALVVFEHLADNEEEKVLVAEDISMWGNMNHDFRDVVKGGNKDLNWQSPASRGMPIHGVMSYMESHDEERLIYDSENYGTVSQVYDLTELENGIDRAKLASAFFFMVPGPKLIWQFGELGYNVSINQYEYEGEVSDSHRTSEKPLISEFDTKNDAIRKELYDVYAALLKLRHDYDLSSLEGDNVSLSLSGDLKTISLKGVTSGLTVKVVGNFSLGEESYTYDYSGDGSNWYSYFNNGEQVDAKGTFVLKPSEFKVLTSRAVEVPADGLVKGFSRIIEVNPYGFKEDEEIEVIFDPSGSDKSFGATITLEAGVVLDSHGSGNISNKKTTTMTKEGDKYVASFTPVEFFGLSSSDVPYQLALTVKDNNNTSEGPFYLDFEDNNRTLYIVGDVLGIGWEPSQAIEMTSDGNGGFIYEGAALTKGELIKFIDDKSWNGGQWGYASEGKLKESSYGDNIEVTKTGTATIRANVNALTYSIEFEVTSVEDELSKSVVAFPNPTTSIATVRGEAINGEVEFQIRDNAGRVLSKGAQIVNNNELNFDLSYYSKGMYYIEIFTSKGRIVKKLMRV